MTFVFVLDIYLYKSAVCSNLYATGSHLNWHQIGMWFGKFKYVTVVWEWKTIENKYVNSVDHDYNVKNVTIEGHRKKKK